MAMENLFHLPQVLADRWRERVSVAFSQYKTAMKAARAAKDLISDAPAPDGLFAFRNATRAETAARNEYMRVLTIYTNLVIHGKIPDEPEADSVPLDQGR
jgi:hypothetical protein